MSAIFPFRALRPVPDAAARVASVPYDVVSSDEARVLAEGNPVSFLHVSRPETPRSEIAISRLSRRRSASRFFSSGP